jgi:2-amino-4-hydroxy-6-hydroxymethyldihydropteridine diphosphokinase
MKPRTAYLGIGSNIDAEDNIRSAIESLRKSFANVSLSPAYRSAPVGFEGDDFINLVASIETALPPLELVEHLHTVEDDHDRDRSAPKWSSRTLDIDILLYGNLWLKSPRLEIPRDEILVFPHVLKPLADLAPNLVHPVERISIAELWSRFPKERVCLVDFRL